MLFIKKCEFCGKDIETKYTLKRFCNSKHQQKDYNKKPEIKKMRSIWDKEYRKRHPEWKERHRIQAVTIYKQKRAEYQKIYGKRAEVREKIRTKERLRLQIDKQFAIADRLRRSLNHAMNKYSKTGKIMSSKKYGINWKEIINSLKPFPDNLREYEIDHIIPLHTFDLTDTEQVKKSFSPSNLQWLTIQENRIKSGKLLINNINENPIGKEVI